MNSTAVEKLFCDPAMKRFLIILAFVLAGGPAFGVAGVTNAVKTSFVYGATLDPGSVESVVNLANLCGISNVVEVSTVQHMGNREIHARGEDRIEGRKVTFYKLLIHRDGWEWRKRPNNVTRRIGEFWVEEPARPELEERMLVKVGDRTFQIGVLNGIKPEGADIVVEAFVTGKVSYESDFTKERVEGIDFQKPGWIGIMQGECYATFDVPLKVVLFKVKDKQVIITGMMRMFE